MKKNPLNKVLLQKLKKFKVRLVGPRLTQIQNYSFSDLYTMTVEAALAAAQRSLGFHFAPHLHYDVVQLLLI